MLPFTRHPIRRLRAELLESRCMLTVMRIGAWNTFNHPNNLADEANFSTVLEAIGNETIQGRAGKIDLLALSETDRLSAPAVANVFDSLYAGSDYESFIASFDGGGDATGFVYDTTQIELIDSTEINDLLTHPSMRGQFRPIGTTGDADFYAYAIHLKAGTGSSDVIQRGTEAALLRADADALGDGANVLFLGDFNWHTSTESAYVNFSADGNAAALDVANVPGNWNNNSAFINLHSHSVTKMDGRFDMHLATDELRDQVGLEYVDGSYFVFGNNGSHPLRGPITAGIGASPATLAALSAASDHLPVIADYEIIVTIPGVGITTTQSAGRTNVTEGGNTDTYTLVLDTFPQQNVSIEVQPDDQIDLGVGPGVAITLVFTPTNAIIPQSIVVAAKDDEFSEQQHTGLILHTVISTDAAYSEHPLSNVVANITDNDERTILINEVDSDTVSTDTLEFIELFDGGGGNTSLDGLVVVLFNGNGDQQYAAFDLDGQVTDSDGFFVLGNAAVANVDLVFNNNTLQNGTDAVALFEGNANEFLTPTIDRLLDAVVYDTDDADDPGLLVLLPVGGQINESDGVDHLVHSIARVPDGGSAFDNTQYALKSPTPGVRNIPAGDYDLDGDVDNDDYVAWSETFGSTTELAADGNRNGIVDAADFVVWKDHFVPPVAMTSTFFTTAPRQAQANPTVVETVPSPAPLSKGETSLGETSTANIYFQPLPKLETAVYRSDQRSSFIDRYFAIFAEDEDVV